MTTARMHDLTFQQLEDGTIQLEQQWGIDDPVSIELHPSQLRHVAEAVGLLEPSKLPEQPHALKKRLERLHDRLVDIFDDLVAVPIYPPGSGSSADDPEARALRDAITALDDVLEDYFPDPEVAAEAMPGKVGQGAPAQAGLELTLTN